MANQRPTREAVTLAHLICQASPPNKQPGTLNDDDYEQLQGLVRIGEFGVKKCLGMER